MGVKTSTSWTLTCDRCPREQPVDFDPLEQDMHDGWQWWVRRGVEGVWSTTQILLCPDCTNRLQLFFQGNTTSAGVEFNQDEARRRHSAHIAQCKQHKEERHQPWND